MAVERLPGVTLVAVLHSLSLLPANLLLPTRFKQLFHTRHTLLELLNANFLHFILRLLLLLQPFRPGLLELVELLFFLLSYLNST